MDIGAWLASNLGGGGGSTEHKPEEPSPTAGGGAAHHLHVPVAAHAAALAAAVAGDGASKAAPKQPGKFLLPDCVFDVDASRSAGDMQPQLQVSPITVVKADYREQMMHQIAVNSTYICYGLKPGHIRTFNKRTSGRVLLREHTSMVTDMRFFSSASNLLASCDEKGEVIVRKIYQEGDGDDAPPIQSEVLVRHSFGPCPPANTRRLAWHPQLESLLAVAALDRIGLVNVPPTSGVAASPEFASPALPSASMTEGAVTTLAFCDRGDMLAVADDKGFVYIWALESEVVAGWEAGGTLEALHTEPDVKFRAFDDKQHVAALDFLPSRPKEPGEEEPRGQQAFLLVGDCTCRTLRLWSIDVEAKPVRTSTLELVSSHSGPSAFFNHMLLQPNLDAVVLANTKQKQVYVVHIKYTDGLAHFDYLTDFAITQPILSMTTTSEPCIEDGIQVYQLFAVQTESVQQYSLFPDLCLPPKGQEEEDEDEQQEVDEAQSGPRLLQQQQPLHALDAQPPHTPPSAPQVIPTLLTAHLAAAAAAAAAAPSPPAVPLISPAEVLNSGWGSGAQELSPAAGEAGALPPGEGAAQQQGAGGSLAHSQSRTASNASDAASPYRPQDGEEPKPAAAREQPAAAATAAPQVADPFMQMLQEAAGRTANANASNGGPAAGPLRPSSSMQSEHGSSGFPASRASGRVAEADEAGGAAAQAGGPDGSSCVALSPSPSQQAPMHEHPMPPQPSTLLVKKLSWAGAGPVFVPVAAAPAAAAPASDRGGPEGEGGAGSASPPMEDEALAAAAAAAALQGGAVPGGGAAAGASNVSELQRMIALQQQLLSQLAFTPRETVKHMRSELAKQAKANEAATAKAIDAALKACAKQAEAERAREAKRERDEAARALAAAAAGVVKDVSARVQDASRASVSAMTNTLAHSVGRALADALPAALASAATDQALERAMTGPLLSALPRAIADAFAASVIPAVERATQAMFGQVDAALSAGLADHLAAARSSSAELGSAVRDATAQMQGAVAQLGTAAVALTAAAERGAAAAAATAAAAGAGTGAGGTLDRSRSGAISLAELEARRDPKTVISGLLVSKDYQGAFMQALNTGSADTTMWLVKQLSPGAVFTEPCPLSQEVLLSLVTHLAHQLQSVDTDVKLAWLVEAAPAIDPKHPQVAEHCRLVLEPIKAQLALLARSSLSGEAGKMAKTAVHLVNSLLHQ